MKLVLMGGSLRPASLNTRLLKYLDRQVQERGHQTQAFAGEALRWPLYEDDLAVPEGAQQLAEALRGAQGLIIVSPEYNAGIPGHLKNAIDWLSTLNPSPWKELPVLLCAASPGAFGGSRGMLSWRATLANMGAFVVPQALPIPHADQNLAEDGTPKEARTASLVGSVLTDTIAFCARMGHNF
ncbi:MAG TPA: NADPH-dependent FMN reductase [Holophagaceae bacterium]|nr:NADPH-dependent FMN reductase [Holophagaceae bacterium]